MRRFLLAATLACVACEPGDGAPIGQHWAPCNTAATLCPLPLEYAPENGYFGVCIMTPEGNACAPNMTCDDYEPYPYIGPSGIASGPFTVFVEGLGNACVWYCATDENCPEDMYCGGGMCAFEPGMEATEGAPLIVYPDGEG